MKFIRKYIKIFSHLIAPPKVINENPRILKTWEHTGWGDRLAVWDWKKRTFYGFLMDKPIPGDIIWSKMKSGRVASFIVSTVDYQRDPPDMFFLQAEDAGYVDEKLYDKNEISRTQYKRPRSMFSADGRVTITRDAINAGIHLNDFR